MSSDNLPQPVLDECDESAKPFLSYDRPVQDAVDDLVAIGVFTNDEFRNVRIGFCGLLSHYGPVATTSCARNTILLDSKYRNKDQSLVLKATLAHEMKHYFQHTEQKTRLGANYCDSDRYKKDRTWMEAEADQFGDEVAALLFVGRPIEVSNSCAVAISIYLDPGANIRDHRSSRGFFLAPPNSTVTAPAASTSKFIKFFAESELFEGRKWTWQNPTLADRRFINGKVYGLKRHTLTHESRTTGPFLMSFSCS